MMREIGGYLRLDTYKLPMLHDGAIALNSGRNCLAYLIQKRNIKKIYLPKFLCASVGDTCKKYGVDVEYYSVETSLMPVIDDTPDGWLYVVNYYGQLCNELFAELKKKHEDIIIDNIQAYFQDPVESIDTIYTCRKFFGVTDGAFLYSDVGLDDSLEEDYSWSRVEHIMGSFELGASAFYSRYASAEEEFENMPIRKMSKLTDNLLRAIDYEEVKKTRTANFSYLHKMFGKINKLRITIPDGPYMYPLFIENGAEVRKKLQQIKVFIPTLWPDVFNICKDDEVEYDMVNNILPIPVDQRYSIKDMEYIVKQVEACLR